jgi:hypothetical protein
MKLSKDYLLGLRAGHQLWINKGAGMVSKGQLEDSTTILQLLDLIDNLKEAADLRAENTMMKARDRFLAAWNKTKDTSLKLSYDRQKYRPGLGRDIPHPKRAHLYEVGEDYMDFRNPMCRYGWNRDNGESYSIWRNNVPDNGAICKVCIKRASKGLPGVESTYLPEIYGYQYGVCKHCDQVGDERLCQ